MSPLTLVIGNRVYSSWSLRPWLALRHTGASFAEIVVPLSRPDTRAELLRHSPAGRVPVLLHGDVRIWDSLAICEYLAELFPAAHLWPEDAAARATARAISAEMHAGFAELRAAYPMNLRRHHPPRALDDTAKAYRDIRRIEELMADARQRFGSGGPFLFGRFSIADAMYAPVLTRFRSYGIGLAPVVDTYSRAVFALPSMIEWQQRADAETWTIEATDNAAPLPESRDA